MAGPGARLLPDPAAGRPAARTAARPQRQRGPRALATGRASGMGHDRRGPPVPGPGTGAQPPPGDAAGYRGRSSPGARGRPADPGAFQARRREFSRRIYRVQRPASGAAGYQRAPDDRLAEIAGDASPSIGSRPGLRVEEGRGSGGGCLHMGSGSMPGSSHD